MIARLLVPALLFVGCAAPALAQEHVSARNPGTVAANRNAASIADVRAAVRAGGQARYEEDRAAYMAALVAHDRAVDRTDRRYARQQQAYADAMAVWRWQADRCRRGNQRACRLPTPDPADFY